LTVDLADSQKTRQSSSIAESKASLPPGSLQLNRQRKMQFKKVKKQRRRAGTEQLCVDSVYSQHFFTPVAIQLIMVPGRIPFVKKAVGGSKEASMPKTTVHLVVSILPPEKNLSGLHSRGHGYVLPICQYSFCKNSFVP